MVDYVVQQASIFILGNVIKGYCFESKLTETDESVSQSESF
jgi:hypothetical protein